MKIFSFYVRHTLWRIWQSRFVRNVAVVASGAASAQLINLAFMPLITRIYGPEAFGVLGTFTAIVSVLAPVAALAYPIAIVIPRENQEALGIVRLSLSVSFTVMLLAIGILITAGDWLAINFGAASISEFLFLIPLAMLFSAWVQIANKWLVRNKKFGTIARTAIAHSILLNGAKTGAGLFHPIGAVLIILGTLGHALHAALLFIGSSRGTQKIPPLLENGSCISLKEIASRYRDFPLYRAPQKLINAGSQSLPVLMLAISFGPASAGFYSLATKALGRPAELLGEAVNSVFYPHITEAVYNNKHIALKISQATLALFFVGLVPFAFVALWGPWFFGFIFGDEWVAAGEYARWLSAWLLVGFANRPSTAAIPALSIQRGFFIYEIISVVTRASSIFIGSSFFHSDVVAVAFFSSTSFALNVFLIAWVIWVAYGYEDERKDDYNRSLQAQQRVT
ncbi:lipopolysaccharide biosynthesis protein [Halorhodospira neutriphila]|uniref:Polysaccharide biosynthesis protein n=1 Tax=Halorhodospira neutriphila TaxID=168379 RepID=A0ABS1E4N6_9GAMM|nr:lipopolysaccharide biosynthesis protein [Halorhodospira neutriphila]MBK1725923.1 polysaccharide biosynthesis protein [Halorhodospira neutriphila]